MHVATLFNEDGVSIMVNGQLFTVARDHINWDKIVEALKAKEYDNLLTLVNVSDSIREWIGAYSDLALDNGCISLRGVPFSSIISDKVFDMIEDGQDAGPLVNFLRKVRENPAASAQNELLLFCEANGFMIHEDGDIVAYKGVRDNYTDSYTGKIFNGPGAVVTMSRNQVNDNREQTCSFGLHFAAYDYASGFSQRLMVMKINPRDIVSIPNDYHNQKGRCCRYVIISELQNKAALPDREVYRDDDFVGDNDHGDDSDGLECGSCGSYDSDNGYGRCIECSEWL